MRPGNAWEPTWVTWRVFRVFAELMESDDPDMANMRFSMDSKRFARYLASVSAVDPERFTRLIRLLASDVVRGNRVRVVILARIGMI